MTRRRQLAGALLLTSAALLAAACGTGAEHGASKRVQHCRPGSVRMLGSTAEAYAAVVRIPTEAYRRPGLRRIAHFGPLNINGVPTVFSARAAVVDRRCLPAWYRVQLPIKPNGRVGYVRASAVRLDVVHTRITVDLSRKLLTFYRDGRPQMRLRVGIGAPATPTPTGSFYVNQRFREDPAGPYGPAALGISAYSNVLTWWAQGGPVAIHGTNRPWTIGQASSNGCIHVANAVLERLFRETPAGTPVVIHA